MGLTGLHQLGHIMTIYVVAVFLMSSVLTCNVNINCDCCKDGGLSCNAVSNYFCSGPCKDGYWGAKCKRECPDECTLCIKEFGQRNECFGCIDGYYGLNCSNTCPSCTSCEKDTGACNSCASGFYGTTCQHTCSLNCLHEKCDINSGNCTDCSNGYFGAMCNQACSTNCKDSLCHRQSGKCDTCVNGQFGFNCNQPCPVNCKYSLCIRDNGICHECNQGYYGTHCNMKCSKSCLNDVCDITAGICNDCIVGYHGLNCTEACPSTCKSMLCDRDQGTCTLGCIENYIGDSCEKCIEGKYGVDCDQDCPSNCLKGECNRTDGTCTYGCNNGFSDSRFCCVNNLHCDMCTSQNECSHCKSGTYGLTCDKMCPVNCDGPCDKTSGNCKTCKLNYFGSKCGTNCSETCLTTGDAISRCSAENGYCDAGCMIGYHGDMCEKSCSDHCNGSCYQESGECEACIYNRYGAVCGNVCPSACVKNDYDTTCSRYSGHCLLGCLKGFYGDTCANNCSGCRDAKCNNSGHCIKGCRQGFTGAFCVTEKNKPTSEPSAGFPSTIVGIAAGGAVVLAICFLVLIVIIRKRRSSPNKRQTQTKLKVPDKVKAGSTGIYENSPTQDAEDEDAFVPEVNQVNEKTYYNTVNLNFKLRTEELYRYLSKSDDMYQKEFLLLPNGLIKPFSDAKLPKNTSRNRYNMVYPYNDSRVKVKHGNSDYINASYIDGYNQKRAYIACLGPTIKNLGDFSLFWKMIWQEKVETIVMVTKLKEASGMKCDQYWPKAGKTLKYGNIKVHSTGEEEYAEFVVRNMTMSMDNEERQFHHIHFTAWPDKGVPSDVISIVSLRNKVTRMRRKFDGPLVVHCSAGIGRTGTYIALDILIRQGLAERTVDVLGCVMNMRQQRVHMVQTVDQYKYLHHAVMWSLSIDTEPVPADKFYDLSWVYKDDGLAKMLRQLQMENWYDTDEETTAVEANSKIPFVNRQNADIPGSRHAVSVMSCERNKPMKAEYINAVFIDGYRRHNRFIAAQTPLPETTSDFLNMIVQRQVGCIIDLEPVDSSQDDVGEYLPDDNDELQNGNVVFKSTKRQQVDGYVKRDLQVIEDKKVQDSRTITHYQFKAWPNSQLVPDSVQFIKLIHEVERLIIKTEQTGPILVHCMNGAERCALFSAMWLLIERIGADNSVSVLNTLRQVKSRRRKAIPNKEQIDFCFQGVATHLNQLNLNVYSNT